MENSRIEPHRTFLDSARTTRMRAVVCVDLADFTAVVERLGDARAADLMRGHDRMARDLLRRHDGLEIDKTDGFLLLFDRAIDAVRFALDYQRRLAATGRDGEVLLRARIGIHVGEVVLWENPADDVARGAKPLEVEGLAKPLAARLNGLARPGQILLSEHAYDLSRRAVGELTGFDSEPRWLEHGRYRLKGVPEPMPVFEVGEKGVAPLKAPESSAKATRELPLWRRRRSLLMEGFALLLFASGALYLALRDSPAMAFVERDWVVVGDLVNLTGESLLDSSLETALRVGLEQSRFVNVVPELQVSASLARMNLGGVGIDRRIGSEIAQREGARAVILPVVAEVGGRVRFSVEVIDPGNGATVFSESEDSPGLDGVLPAMDRVVTRLRSRLGESMDSIEARSAPLERVTTGNLEALKAYSLGVRALAKGDPRTAVMLLNRAIELDPAFSAAHAKLAGIHLLADEPDKLQQALEIAYTHRARLTERERLHLEGMMATQRSPEAMLERWGQLAALYPDYLVGQQNLGSAYWMHEYRHAAALEQFQHLIDSQHPLRGMSMQNAAVMLTGLGEFERAAALYARAFSEGAGNLFDGPVDLHLAQRQHEKAFDSLSSDLSRDLSSMLLWKGLRRIAVLADQGRADAALSTIQELRANPTVGLHPAHAVRLELARLAILAERHPDQAAESLDSFLSLRADALRSDEISPQDSGPTLILAGAILAARVGASRLAERHRDALIPRIAAPRVFERIALSDALRLELAHAAGREPEPDAAAAHGGVYDGRTLYLREFAAARLDLALGRADALGRLAELCRDRKLAVAEWGSGFALLVPNILASNRACAEALTAARASGDHELAERMRAILAKAWEKSDPDWPGREIIAVPIEASLDQENPES